MSTDVLHYGANERRAIMLEKLGGKDVLQQAIDIFYNRQMNDVRLHKFFEGVDIQILKWHQFNLMSIAFTAVPENFNVQDLILNRHTRLFDEGLNEDYYDVVLEHFSSTLKEMKVDPVLIEEALQVVMPLRDIFAQGAREAQERKQVAKRMQRVTRAVTMSIVVTIVAVSVMRFVKTSFKK